MGHIPEESTSFVGRVSELTCLDGALTGHRLVTLTGIGGVGKTRLALRAAARAAERYQDGVWWSDLSSLDGERLLLATVSDAVDLADHTSRMPVESLCEWLAGKEMLLVLDSCEHLVDSCRDLVADLLTTVPGLTVLTTSRQPLGLEAEHVIDVLPMPAEGQDATSLFKERATAAGAAGRLAEPGADEAVLAICRRLEGVPLALELAAAQVGRATVQEVAERLGSRFDLVSRSLVVWPQRHRALRTTIGWSHELCRPVERLLWARLTIFRGGFDLESARSVCSGGPLSAEAVGPVLERLVAQSVVRRDGDHYRMLDTIREYGQWWLRALAEESALADRHAFHYLRLARQADEGWLSADQAGWYRWVNTARTDLCTALDHLLATAPRYGLDLAGLIGFFWSGSGRLHETRGYLEQGLAAYPAHGPERTRALWVLGLTVTLQGQYEDARRLSVDAARAAWEEGDNEAVVAAANISSLISVLTGQPLAAQVTTDHALEVEPGRHFASAARFRCHLVRVFALIGLGKLRDARAEAEALRDRCVELDECWTRSYLDYQLSIVALLAGNPTVAACHARTMLDGKRLLRDNFGIALGLDVLAAAIAAQGEAERAAGVFGVGQAYWRTVGHPQRGTPELGPIRAECERSARAGIGDEAYERAFRRGASADLQAALASVLDAASPIEA
ncbi:NB-ARC domain-containing protein [Streptomyces sp. NPDC006733]|uniref:ATP-binding protein n=1 Tax=Streptomyces sp. NPDC006733 TaxID=3155460 RepID=UPI0033F1FC67